MWPNKRLQNSPVWRYTDPSTPDTGDKRVMVRKRETRRMVRVTMPAQRQGGSK
jgi:hypothetical protein